MNNDGGFSTFDPKTGQLMGVITDYVTYAVNCMGENALQFNLVGFDSQDELIQALKNDEIDMIFHASQNPYEAEQNELALSNTVMSPSIAVVTSQKSFNENAENLLLHSAGALSVYDNALRKVTLIDFIKDNLLVFATGSGLIFLAIVAVILSPLRKTKSAEAKAK